MPAIQHLLLRNILLEDNRYNISFFSHHALESFHDHDYFEFIIITGGGCTHICNRRTNLLKCNDIVLMRPGDIHIFTNLSPDFASINIVFEQTLMDSLIGFLGPSFDTANILLASAPPVSSLTAYTMKQIRTQAEQLLIAFKIKGRKTDYNFRAFVLNLFVNYMTPWSTLSNLENNIPEWLQALIVEMIKPEVFSVGMPAVYEVCEKSPEHISRAFAKYFKSTPNSFITELRMDFSAQHLIYTDASIADIAADSGYDNLSTFYHVFKKKYHVSPKAFREQYRHT